MVEGLCKSDPLAKPLSSVKNDARYFRYTLIPIPAKIKSLIPVQGPFGFLYSHSGKKLADFGIGIEHH